jgi:hypothetical protein
MMRGWKKASICRQKQNYDGPILTEYETLGIIHSTKVSLQSPILDRSCQAGSLRLLFRIITYNWDGLASPVAIRHSMDTLRVVINKVTNLPDINDPAAVAEAAASSSWASSFIGEDEDENEPMSDYLSNHSINDVTIDTDDVEEPAVGFALTFYWRDLITNILPPNSKGVIVVFENTCDQVFTYRIDGENAIYVGQGDQHDSKYDSLGVSSH